MNPKHVLEPLAAVFTAATLSPRAVAAPAALAHPADPSHQRRTPAVIVMLALALGSLLLAPSQPASAQGITLQFAELHVSSSWVQYLSSWLIPGAPGYFLIFDVRNTGADAGPFTVEVRNKTSGQLAESFPVTGMKAGGGRRFWHKLPDPPHCGYEWSNRRILVDSANVIVEVNNANNSSDANYQYGSGPC